LESEPEAADVAPVKPADGVDEDSSYESYAEADYLNLLDVALAEDVEQPKLNIVTTTCLQLPGKV
jgi:hypothetical protein